MSRPAEYWLAELRELGIERPVRIMNVCGGHERSISHAGLRTAIPSGIELVPGPGCPVCICPEEDVFEAIQLALNEDVILVAFGDMLRVPVNVPKRDPRSLEQARAAGGDIRPIASPLDAVRIANDNPDRKVVFFAAGFETTTAPVAAMLAEVSTSRWQARWVSAIAPLTSEGMLPELLERGDLLGAQRAAQLGRAGRGGEPQDVAALEPGDHILDPVQVDDSRAVGSEEAFRIEARFQLGQRAADGVGLVAHMNHHLLVLDADPVDIDTLPSPLSLAQSSEGQVPEILVDHVLDGESRREDLGFRVAESLQERAVHEAELVVLRLVAKGELLLPLARPLGPLELPGLLAGCYEGIGR